MTNIEKCFAGNGDDGSLIEHQFLCRAGVKRESRPSQTEHRVANLTPLRFCWYFNDNDFRLVASRDGANLPARASLPYCRARRQMLMWLPPSSS